MSNFKGRVAIVTGAASGIGKQVALRFAAEGAEPDPRSPADVRKLILSEMDKWAKVAKLANIRTD